MPSAGPNAPGTASTLDWTNPNNGKVEDGSFATLAQAVGEDSGLIGSNGLVLTNYGFSIPAGATVVGIEVRIKRERTTEVGIGPLTITDSVIELVTAGDDFGDPLTDWPSANASRTYGGPADDLGFNANGGNAALVNSSAFGVRITARNQDSGAGHTAKVDYAAITVYYLDPAGGRFMKQYRQRRI